MVTSITSDKIIDQRYQIVTTIGQGGMGKVYLVVDLEKNRQVALKTLERDLNDQAAWGRFEREARNASRLNHPNIARIYDFGKLNGEVPYLVMELITGQTLHERIRSRGPLSEEEVLTVFLAMASALQHAHLMDTLHRDIKPANIVVITDRVGKIIDAKLIDFGLAKCFAEDEFAQSLTATGELIGSPFYMSPEHWNSQALGPGSDIYSLGITLFEALTGKVPFSGENPFATAVSHNTAPLPRLADFTDALIDDSDWQIVLDKMLAKSIDDRYRSAAQFAHDLYCIANGEDVNPQIEELFDEEPAKSTKLNNLLLLIGACAVFLLLTCVVSMIFFATAKAPKNTPIKPAFERLPSHSENVNEKMPNFSVYRDSQRHIFEFSDTTKIGFVSVEKPSFDQPATGTIEVKHGDRFMFRPSDLFLMHPEMFRRFGPYDLNALFLQGVPAVVNDQVLSNIRHLTGLRHLIVRNSTITANAVDTFNCFPQLDNLTLVDTEVTGASLANLKRLKELDSLTANDAVNPTPYLVKLVGSTSLRQLSVKSVDLSDDDLKLIALIPNLKELTINSNPKVTAKGLSYLPKCKKLKKLQIKHMGPLPGAAAILGQLKSLKTLMVDSAVVSTTELAPLQQALPECNIDFGDSERE
ncbi:MAG: serine/threonine-protein kinase [Candidatus Obscuribacterales bacterium]